MRARSLLSRLGPSRRPDPRMHLVDTTLFYSPTSGGVRRYLSAKHAWLAAHGSWTHSILVPGGSIAWSAARSVRSGLSRPGHFQLSPAAQSAPLGRTARLARAGHHRGGRCVPPGLVRVARRAAPRHTARRFLSFEPAADHRQALGLHERARGRPLRPLALQPLRCGLRAEPPDVQLSRQPRRAAHRISASRCGR